VRVAPEVPAQTRGDGLRVRQILTNLVDNAIKFTDRGGVEIRLTVAAADPGHVMLCYEVEDSGIGISPEARTRVFAPYTQVDGVDKDRGGGTGLGLSISRQLCQRMGGEITVRAASERGSVFAFQVRVARVNAAAAAGPRAGAVYDPSRGPRRVLVVDDNPINRFVMLKLLHRIGVAVDAVESGAAALRTLARETYELVLLDCQMPDMDGYETARTIIASIQPRPRIVALTASASSEDRGRSLAAGMDDHLVKPITRDALVAALAAAGRGAEVSGAGARSRV
jgi:CheY-like chemotaxis protein